MDLAVISTYRCCSRCSMCYAWRHPSEATEEIGPEVLERLPEGFGNLSITGGEPTLRRDLPLLVDTLRPKARVLEIASNGLLAHKLLPIVSKHPDIKVRFSLEGIGATNDRIRGEPDGFGRKVEGLQRLKDAGATDLGFGAVIQDANADELLDLYRLCREHGVEFATSALHGGFQFHRTDDALGDRQRVARGVEALITQMLRERDLKVWFRAYLNLGLLRHVLGLERMLPCAAGAHFAFIDPWANVFACNVRLDTYLGNLRRQSWREIMDGPARCAVVARVAECRAGCWMVTTARCAMRSRIHPRLPKAGVAAWVLANALRVRLGLPVPFERHLGGAHRSECAIACYALEPDVAERYADLC